MDFELSHDPDLEAVFAGQVKQGHFATLEEARLDFARGLDRAIAEADAGLGVDADVVFDRLLRRYAEWPRAAE